MAIYDLQTIAEGDAVLGQVAQHLGVGVRHAHEAPGYARRQVVQAVSVALFYAELDRRDRIAVRIDCRVA